MTWVLRLRLEIGRKPVSAPVEPDGISDMPQPITVFVDATEPPVRPLGFEARK